MRGGLGGMCCRERKCGGLSNRGLANVADVLLLMCAWLKATFEESLAL